MKTSKKLLSVLLSVLMIALTLSCLSVCFTTSAVSGTDGNIIWTFEEYTGTLHIDGRGAMRDYEQDYYNGFLHGETPWDAYYNLVTTIEISPGVTTIGTNAFEAFTNLTSVTISDTVTDIGYDAFAFCEALHSVTIPDSVTHIGASTFMGCNALTNVYYTGTREQWNNDIYIESGNGPLISAKNHYYNEFDQIPTFDSDALQEGDLWFDLADFVYYMGLAGRYSEAELAEFQIANYAVNQIRRVLRVTVDGVETDYDTSSILFLYVLTHGYLSNEGFHEIPTEDSPALAEGDYWFDWAALAADSGMTPEQAAEELQYIKFYVNDDGSTLRVVQYGVRIKDVSAAADSEDLYAHLRQHGNADVFNPIPTADSDALQNGDKWFDLADFLLYARRMPDMYSAEEVAAFEAATYSINQAGTILRVTVDGVDTDYDENSLLILFVQEHGVDLTEGFTEIPTADSADLAEGAYWFDMATYVADAGLDPAQAAEDAQLTKFYVNNDGTVLRLIQLNIESIDFTAANNPNEGGLNLYDYLRPHINANGYTLLPNADSDALNNGDCWFDLNAMLIANTHGLDETDPDYIEIAQRLTKVQIYLKNDGTSMKFFWNGDIVELSPGDDDESGWTYFLRVHGAPQFDGFTLLPTADSADLAAGAYWYDKAAYMDSLTQGMDPADEEEAFVIWMYNAIYGNRSYYLSDDDQTLKVYLNPLSTADIARSDAGSGEYFDFLKQHEGPVEIVDSETDVVISADAGVLPANTVLVVVPDAPVANIEIGSGSLENYNHEAYDVSLTFNGEAVQPVGGAVTVKLPIPAGYNKNSIVVYYVDDNGNKTDMHATVEGDYAVFTVDHFSTYVVVDTTCLHNGATEVRGARAATCKTDGYSGDTYCLLCGNKIATGAAIPKDTVAHTPGTAVKENVVNATTEHGGSYDEVVRCTVCGNVISSTHKTTDPLPQPQPQNVCKWCGKVHEGFFQKIIGFFHRILAAIFGARY